MNRRIIFVDQICRHLICFLMLVYGIVKSFQGQFYSDFHWRDSLLGELNARQLAWAFYGHSALFERILGLAEIGLAILLLVPRTAALGTVLFVPFALHLVALNFFYEINAFATAIPLLAAGLVLVWTRWSEIRAFWICDPETTSKEDRGRWPVVTVVTVMAASVLAGMVIYNNKFKLAQDPQIRGAWKVVEPSSAPLHSIYFEKGTQCVAREHNGQLIAGRWRVHSGSLQLNEFLKKPSITATAPYKLVDNNTLLLEMPDGVWILRRIEWQEIGELN